MRSYGARVAFGALCAAVYIALTLLAWGFNLASGLIQVRFSEALCVLAYFSPYAVGGLFVGCLISNLVTGALLPDIILGSLATLIAAMTTYGIRKVADRADAPWLCALAPAPAVVSNAVIVGWLLVYVYGVNVSYSAAAIYVAVGEAIACYGLGMPLLFALRKLTKKYNIALFN